MDVSTWIVIHANKHSQVTSSRSNMEKVKTTAEQAL